MLQQLIVNGLIASSIYSLVALGFAIIFQTTRFFHFAHGAVYTFGAYFAYLFSVQLGIDRFLAFPLACIATMLLGLALIEGHEILGEKMTDIQFTSIVFA